MPYSFNPLSGLGLDQSIPLDGAGKIPSDYLPSYVDDVVEYANLAGFPATGETGKIYVAIDTSFTYRWSGSVYIQINSLTGTFAADAGTAAAPSISIGTADNGLYAPAEDQVAISTNGTGRLFIDSSGNVGLGTSSPDSYSYNDLVVAGSTGGMSIVTGTSGTGRLVFADGIAGVGAYRGAIQYDHANDRLELAANGATSVYLNSTGLGIGSTEPARQLTVYNSSAPIIQLVNSTTGQTANDGVMLYESGSDFIIENQEAGEIKIYNNGSQRAAIDSSGRLLVGTSTAPGSTIASTALLQVQGRAGYPSDYALANLRAGYTPSGADAALGFLTFSDSSNNIGAWITAYSDGGGWTSGSNHRSRLTFSTTADGASSPTERMRISQNGEFNCYTGSNDGFSVRTSAGAGTGAYIYQGFNNASSTTTGTVVYRVYSNGTYATISDATQKKNISTARDGYLEDLNALRVVKYHWNEQDDSEQRELGLIAQEVETVFPGLIAEFDSDAGETIKGIKNSVLTFMLIKALQEATGRIETLEAEVAALKAS